jgi:hypothetical protein
MRDGCANLLISVEFLNRRPDRVRAREDSGCHSALHLRQLHQIAKFFEVPSTAAWTDPSGPMNNPFLLDANIMPGDSGGPVYKVPIGLNRTGSLAFDSKVAFLGIVSSDISRYYTVTADGRIVQKKWDDLPLPSTEMVQVVGVGGLGKVEPAAKVRKVIESVPHQ